ncbi:NCS1 family transporter [Planococcus halocryophilus]|uniref:NCS1 family transporter n=1 Tax=Planococcus halocryophilus TaxID=1215089 RepID=UPI001F0FD7BC|nr:NCS1 family transporter [Planococcus halocryophilus]MCH4825358.1 NCS1 family transporter [Planococcus halocryophilus]
MRKNSLISKDIIPTKGKNRVISGWGFFNIWVGMAVIIATFQIGANGIESMSLWQLAGAILLANLIIAIIGSLSGDIGIEHGLSFAAYMRAPFGTAGVHIPAISRGIIAAIWFGIQTYLGATAINYIVNMLTGFDSWFVWYLVFAAVQIINTAIGIKAVDRFAAIAAPAIIVISVWIFIDMVGLAADNGINVFNYVGTTQSTTWFLVMVANMGFWSALAVDIPNITRYVKAPMNERNWFKRNKNNYLPHIIALPLVQTFMGVIGAVSLLAAGLWNPIEVIQATSSGWVLIILLTMVVLAQWSTNSAANLIPASLTFVNAGAKFNLSYTSGIVIAGVVGTLFQPWSILNQLFTFLGYYGAILSAVAGIIICDYYIIRKRRLAVRDLYDPQGQFRFDKGVNWAGMIAWIAAGGLAVYFIQYMYLVGFPLGVIFYYLLMKFWYLKKHPQKEVVSNYSDAYLGTTVGRDWEVEGLVEEQPNSKGDWEIDQLNPAPNDVVKP